jgi:ribonuclease Z
MEKFEITILGCGSATPGLKHFTSSQVLNIREKLFMIDCGEGTQIQMRRTKIAFGKLNHIFISHLHGDHCFGLLGIISSFGLLGRTAPLFVHAPADMWKILKPELDFYCQGMEYEVEFCGFNPKERTVIYDDKSLSVETIPLKHRIPTAGFLFKEKPLPDHLDRAAADFYGVPQWDYNRIKNGGDFVTADGRTIPHNQLTKPATPPRSYAYCCDTEYNPDMIEQITGVSTIYHDCTYSETDKERAKKHFHSTAAQAANTAKQAEAGTLILGHFSARYNNENILLEEAKEIFKNSYLAKENANFTIE